MSNKASGLVWDLECPATVNGIPFRPNHKYVLVSYADHADHNGRNIFPAIGTISRKTGLDERTVQRMTRDLESIGYLIEDGQGPRGTHRWKLPYSERGDSLSPVRLSGVTADPIPSGDIPSGDIPSGDSLSPDLKEPLTLLNNDSEFKDLFLKVLPSVFPDFRDRNTLLVVTDELQKTAVLFDGSTFTVSGLPEGRSEYYESRYKRSFERAFVGLLGSEVSIDFTGSRDALTS